MTNDDLGMLQLYRADAVTLRLAVERHARHAQRESMDTFARAVASVIARMFAWSRVRAPRAALRRAP